MFVNVWSAFSSAFWPFLAASCLASVLAVWLATTVANPDDPDRRLALICGYLFFTLLLYPRPIYFSTLQIAVTRTTSSLSIASSQIGIASILFPQNLGLAYLLVGYAFRLNRIREQVTQLKLNLSNRPLLRTTLTVWAYRTPFFAIAALLVALNNFQSVPLGSSGPITPGTYLGSLLSSPAVSQSTRLSAIAYTILFFGIGAVAAPMVLIIATGLLPRTLIHAFTRRRNSSGLRHPFSGTKHHLIIGTAAAAGLHLLILSRLVGVLPGWYERLGLGQDLIDPTQFLAVLPRLSGTFDIGLVAAIATAMIAVVSSFAMTNMGTSVRSDATRTFVTLSCGTLAFFPSAMYGTLILTFPSLSAPVALITWGALQSASLWGFLQTETQLEGMHHLYANIRSTRGWKMTVRTYVKVESSHFLLLTLFVSYWVWLDDGYHAEIGATSSFSSLFLDRQMNWGGDLRLLALVNFVVSAVLFALIEKRRWSQRAYHAPIEQEA